MKRRYALFPVIFVASLLIGIQAVEVADADPFFIFHQVDPVPGTTPSISLIYFKQHEKAQVKYQTKNP